jgi:D-proline reductase (dithiol) PrdB
MESEELLKDLLAIPREAAFNRVRYIGAMMGEEEQIEFIKGLFAKAVESREAKNPDALFDFLETWEEKGMALSATRAKAPFELGAAPWSPLNVPISKAKVALVTTGGFYVSGDEPFITDGPDNKGDYSFRAIPRTTPADKLEVFHLHYDLSGPKEDRNCVFPIDRAEELVKDGVIGSLADTYYSFMGFIQEPEILAKETAPEVARLLKTDGVDAVVLTAT